MQELIRVEDVEKYYGRGKQVTKAVTRISFEIRKGEFTGIMGASGSGKTTLINLMATIDKVTSGHIFYNGKDITGMKEDELADFRKENLGFVFQDFNLLDTLTIKENIELAMSLCEKSKKKIENQAVKMMKALGIDQIGDKFPYEVSGGQKQRCACARALINHPQIIFADEPTGALDSRSARMLLQTFEDMNRKLGATILMVTHDAFSASYCERILFLKDGQIFNELRKGDKDRKTFLNQILDVLSLTGGDPDAQ